MNDDREPNAPLTVVAGIVGAVLLFVVVVVLQAVFYNAERAEERRKVTGSASDELVQLKAEQEELLNKYRWVDQGRGVAGIPIERAMALVVAREQGTAGGVAARGGGAPGRGSGDQGKR